MGFGGGASMPAAPPVPPPPPAPAQAASPGGMEAQAQERASLTAASGAGFAGTIASSPQGAPAPATARKTLLGG